VPWDWEKSGVAEADCFLCHVPNASRGARRKQMAAGNFRWANNATLTGTGLVTEQEKGAFTYNRAAFNTDGTVKPETLDLSDPTIENCAMCHGFTARNTTTIQPIQFADIARGTEKAGWIYNGAKISDTVTPKIVGKEKMDYPWDAHAAKGGGLHRLSLFSQQPRPHDPRRPEDESPLQTHQRRHRRLSQTARPQFRPRQHPSRNRQRHKP
jgi:hypothetical protein